MSALHFVNESAELVNAALYAVTLTNPAVGLDAAHKIVYRRRDRDSGGTDDAAAQPPRVSLVSGGGSGHEPAFSSLVGRGLLSAAVVGTVFASPSAAQVRAALARVDGRRGVLVVVMNYTGDLLSFGMAVERARAAGLRAEIVIVGDDVGVGRARAGRVGRRGVAGTVLVVKAAGALAEMGRDLDAVARVARLVAAHLVSVGASLQRVHVPGRAAAADEDDDPIEPGQAELGMGIHNEPGCGRTAAHLPALVGRMLAQLLAPSDADRAFVPCGPAAHVVLLVNNLGGVSPLEIAAVTAEVVRQLEHSWRLRLVRVLAGTFMTSLNSVGFSITLLKIVGTGPDTPSLLELLDHPSEAAGWSAPVSTATWDLAHSQPLLDHHQIEHATTTGRNSQPGGALRMDPGRAAAALRRGLDRVVAAEPEITRYDTVVGDGDCGIGMKRGAQAILHYLASAPFSGDVVADVCTVAGLVETHMDGTSGALYTVFLHALAHALRCDAAADATPALWAAALSSACTALARYTPARPGDRTIIDALVPFVDELVASGDPAAAATAARRGADATRGMRPVLGRAVYVGGDAWERVPDPGAWGLACFLEGLLGS